MFNGNFMTKLRSSNGGAGTAANGFQGGQKNYDAANQAEREGSSAFGTAASSVGNNRIGTTSGVGHQNAAAASNYAHLFNLVNQRKTPSGTSNQQ